MYTAILILHLISAIALISIVLLQAGKGGGLSGAFGSGMGSETLFGARTGDMLTRTTAIIATVFIISSLTLAYLSVKTGSVVSKKIKHAQQQEQLSSDQLKRLQELLKTKAAEEKAASGEEAFLKEDINFEDISLEPDINVKPAPDATSINEIPFKPAEAQ